MNIEQAIDTVKAEFNFKVNKQQLFNADMQALPMYGLFRSDTGQLVTNSSVSEHYTEHTSDDICALVESASGLFDGQVNLKCVFDQGHKVILSPTDQHRREICGQNDNVFPRVIISAGYNAKAFSACMGMYRDLCQNLAMIQSVENCKVSIRHTSGLYGKMADLQRDFQYIGNSWDTLVERIQEMKQRDVQMVNFLDTLYGKPSEDSKRSITIHENRTRSIFTRLQRERQQTGKGAINSSFTVNAWEAFNAVQGYVQHDKTRKGSLSKVDRALKSLNDPIVAKAEKLALELVV
jgi:hypothetical protein